MDSLREAVTSTLEKMHIKAAAPDAQSQLLAPTDDQVAALKAKYAHEAQDHVFTFWDTLSSLEKTQLYHQLASIDPARVTAISTEVLSPSSHAADSTPSLSPPPDSCTASTLDASSGDIDKWRHAGLEAIAQGKVAVLLMAGGQGTRLGSSAPKGCYDIGLPSGKSLFQLQAERLFKLQELAAESYGNRGAEVVIPWYIMTSGPTRKETEDFLRTKNYFGLKVISPLQTSPAVLGIVKGVNCRRRM
jgi:UDP-N-acetylglucosamine/UDP-N-acetylgalactosamine diphosphorylase